MAFFDGWGKKITDTVDVVGKKTNDMVEIQKLRSQISSLEKGIEKNYVELGKMVFAKYQDKEALSESEKALCEEITGSAVLIEEYENEIADIRGIKKCPSCGAASPADTAYCPKCGTKLEGEEADAQAADASEPEAKAAEDTEES